MEIHSKLLMNSDDLKNIYLFLVKTVPTEGLATLYTAWSIATVVAEIGLEYVQARHGKILHNFSKITLYFILDQEFNSPFYLHGLT